MPGVKFRPLVCDCAIVRGQSSPNSRPVVRYASRFNRKPGHEAGAKCPGNRPNKLHHESNSSGSAARHKLVPVPHIPDRVRSSSGDVGQALRPRAIHQEDPQLHQQRFGHLLPER